MKWLLVFSFSPFTVIISLICWFKFIPSLPFVFFFQQTIHSNFSLLFFIYHWIVYRRRINVHNAFAHKKFHFLFFKFYFLFLFLFICSCYYCGDVCVCVCDGSGCAVVFIFVSFRIYVFFLNVNFPSIVIFFQFTVLTLNLLSISSLKFNYTRIFTIALLHNVQNFQHKYI